MRPLLAALLLATSASAALTSGADACAPLVGLVHSDAGGPLGGARVRFGSSSAWTSPDGRVESFPCGGGPLQVQVGAPYHDDAALTVQPEADGSYRFEATLARVGPRLFGVVRDDWTDAPIAGALLEVEIRPDRNCSGEPGCDPSPLPGAELRPEYRSRNLTTITDEAGRYALALGPGWAGLRITLEGYRPGGGGLRVFFEELQFNASLRPIPTKTAVLEGVVLRDGQPVPNAEVEVRLACGTIGGEGATPGCDDREGTTTGAQGRFRFVLFPNGYDVTARAGGLEAREDVYLERNNGSAEVQLELGPPATFHEDELSAPSIRAAPSDPGSEREKPAAPKEMPLPAALVVAAAMLASLARRRPWPKRFWPGADMRRR